jgi:phosphoribosyl-dephospho-CoA transferase
MKNFIGTVRRIVRDLYRIGAGIAALVVAWNVVRRWHAGLAEKTGHKIDVTIHSTAERLEKTAAALEKESELGLGENLGKGVDAVVMDAKRTIDTATGFFQHALNHAK